MEPLPKLKRVENRFVELAVVENKLVVVALVPVALMKVKFCKVEEPVTKRFERVESPRVAVRVPVKLAAELIVWLFMRPEVIGPAVNVPMFPKVANKLVEEALVEKKDVVVADVPVALRKVKFWRVDDPVNRRLAKVVNPPLKVLMPLKVLLV